QAKTSALESLRQELLSQKEASDRQTTEIEELATQYEEAKHQCALLETRLADKEREKAELARRCETSESLRNELQAQLDGDKSRLLKEKNELEETVDRLNSAVAHRDQVIQSERQQTKMLQEFMKKMNEDIKKKDVESVNLATAPSGDSIEELKKQIDLLVQEKASLKADLSQKIDLFLETDDMRERKEKENLSRISMLEKELNEAKTKKSDNEQIVELENQVEFSNSIIATQQHKIEKLMEEIAQINNVLGEEGIEVQFEKKKKKKRKSDVKIVRKFCDICDVFDRHDTEDCPSQTLAVDDMEPLSKRSGLVEESSNSKRGWIRKFCDHCDEFDLHDTEDCPNPQF
uniref:CLIP1_ZNF domain-containing protein n=1 Tax=Steinernema glaseri TaxID=37863 RepID=A0A1I7YL20_9BILA